VNLSDVDPMYFGKPYYVVTTGAEKAFAVLLTAMEQEGKVLGFYDENNDLQLCEILSILKMMELGILVVHVRRANDSWL